MTGLVADVHDAAQPPQPLDDRFESKVPTLFEYFRKAFRVPPQQTLMPASCAWRMVRRRSSKVCVLTTFG